MDDPHWAVEKQRKASYPRRMSKAPRRPVRSAAPAAAGGRRREHREYFRGAWSDFVGQILGAELSIITPRLPSTPIAVSRSLVYLPFRHQIQYLRCRGSQIGASNGTVLEKQKAKPQTVHMSRRLLL